MSLQSVLVGGGTMSTPGHVTPHKWIKLTPILKPISRRKRKVQFPNQVALGLALTKVVTGALIISAGVLALQHNAALSAVGAGLWCGSVVILSGFLGVMVARLPRNKIYVLSFMSLSFLSLVVSILMVYFASNGFAKDYGETKGQEGHPIMKGESKRPAIIMNSILLFLGVLDILLSLFSLSLCVRQTWRAGVHQTRRKAIPIYVRHPFPKDKLMRLVHRSPQWVTPQGLPSTIYKPKLYVPDSFVNSSYRSSSQFSSQLDCPQRTLETRCLQKVKKKSRRDKHRRRSERNPCKTSDFPEPTKEVREPEVTEEDIQKTYTGLDKQMADSFIQMYMEPHRREMEKSTL